MNNTEPTTAEDFAAVMAELDATNAAAARLADMLNAAGVENTPEFCASMERVLTAALAR